MIYHLVSTPTRGCFLIDPYAESFVIDRMHCTVQKIIRARIQ